MESVLSRIADDLDGLLSLSEGSETSDLLPSEHAATFRALAIEAKATLDEKLGYANSYSMALLGSVRSVAGGLSGRPSYASVQETSKIIRAAIRSLEWKRVAPRPALAGARHYVDPARIVAIQALRSSEWDFRRLAELCREINLAAAGSCHMSTAMLLRTILDHVPPILGFKNFVGVANNYGDGKGQRSFKASMQRLELSLRKIADMHLHSPIRSREDIPTAVQVDFAAELDILLGEIIRVAGEEPPHSQPATQ